MDRIILHSDMNCFYASVELLSRPELKGRPVAVAGDPQNRHGIILAKSQAAKEMGVKTAEAIWQAREKCPDLILLPPHYPKYIHYSQLARKIYNRYTDQLEGFGLDEAWMDVTGSQRLFGGGMDIARSISRTIKEELGLTVSIGVSWNKVFAKFGSDYKKPDAITEINRGNYKDLVWNSPIENLLYCGRATTRKLNAVGVKSIGQLARLDDGFLKGRMGKIGLMLKAFALGQDISPVRPFDEALGDTRRLVKSIGNGYTAPRDLETREDVKMMTTILSESVAARLRTAGLLAQTLSLHLRDKQLHSITRQKKFAAPSDITEEFITTAMAIFDANYFFHSPIRSMSIQACDLVDPVWGTQIDFFTDQVARERTARLDRTIDDLRTRYGNQAVRRAITLGDSAMRVLDPLTDNVVHPNGFLH